MLRLKGCGVRPIPLTFLKRGEDMSEILQVETPWYKWGYAANARVLFNGVNKIINETFAAIFGTDQTDVLAVFMTFFVVALVAGLLLYIFRKSKK